MFEKYSTEVIVRMANIAVATEDSATAAYALDAAASSRLPFYPLAVALSGACLGKNEIQRQFWGKQFGLTNLTGKVHSRHGWVLCCGGSVRHADYYFPRNTQASSSSRDCNPVADTRWKHTVRWLCATAAMLWCAWARPATANS